LTFFAQALTEGREAGLLHVSDASVSASTIWASLHGTVSLLLAERLDVQIDRESFITTAIRQTIQGYLPSTMSSP